MTREFFWTLGAAFAIALFALWLTRFDPKVEDELLLERVHKLEVK